MKIIQILADALQKLTVADAERRGYGNQGPGVADGIFCDDGFTFISPQFDHRSVKSGGIEGMKLIFHRQAARIVPGGSFPRSARCLGLTFIGVFVSAVDLWGGTADYEMDLFEPYRVPVHGNLAPEAQTRLRPDDLQSEVLRSCSNCHLASGIHSVLIHSAFIYSQTFELTSFELTSSVRRPPELADSNPEHEAVVAIQWKQRQFDWGLLQGLCNHFQ